MRFVTENNNFSQNVEYFRKFPAKVSEKSQPDSPDQAGRSDVFFVCVRPTVSDKLGCKICGPAALTAGQTDGRTARAKT